MPQVASERKQKPRISISGAGSKYLDKLAKKTGKDKTVVLDKIVKYVKEHESEFVAGYVDTKKPAV